MPQSSFLLDGESNGRDVLIGIEGALVAIASSNSGDSFPSETYPGMWHLRKTTSDLYIRNATDTNWIAVGNLGIPGLGLGQQVGDYLISARSSIPKHERCEGQALSRATYADLWNLIGDTFGAGNGTTTFNLYDARGRSLAFPNQSNASGLSNRAVGDRYGAETVSLTAANNGPHIHTFKRGSFSTQSNSTSAIVADNNRDGYQAAESGQINSSGEGRPFSIIGPTGIPGYLHIRALP